MRELLWIVEMLSQLEEEIKYAFADLWCYAEIARRGRTVAAVTQPIIDRIRPTGPARPPRALISPQTRVPRAAPGPFPVAAFAGNFHIVAGQ